MGHIEIQPGVKRSPFPRAQTLIKLPAGTYIYISGPMSGYADFNRRRFAELAEKFRAMGLVVGSPPELNELHGLSDVEAYSEYMRGDYREICGYDAMFMMVGWQASVGCNRELRIATEMALAIIFEEGRVSI